MTAGKSCCLKEKLPSARELAFGARRNLGQVRNIRRVQPEVGKQQGRQDIPVGYVDVVGVQPLVRPDNLIRPPCSGSVDQSCEFPTRSSAVTARADHEQAS
jgi:hypothetical protein